MGGEIWVESSLNEGTSFFFTLYAKVTHSRRKVNFTASSGILKDRHVLIVDDGEINRHILDVQTARWGMVPHVFARPDDALSWLLGGTRTWTLPSLICKCQAWMASSSPGKSTRWINSAISPSSFLAPPYPCKPRPTSTALLFVS